jgi:hypothetical protein
MRASSTGQAGLARGMSTGRLELVVKQNKNRLLRYPLGLVALGTREAKGEEERLRLRGSALAWRESHTNTQSSSAKGVKERERKRDLE